MDCLSEIQSAVHVLAFALPFSLFLTLYPTTNSLVKLVCVQSMLYIQFESWHHISSHLQCSWTGHNILPKQLTKKVFCKNYSPGFTLLPVPPARNLSSCLLSYSCWIQNPHRMIFWPSKLVLSKIHDGMGPDYSFPKSSFTTDTAPPTTLRVRHVTELW